MKATPTQRVVEADVAGVERADDRESGRVTYIVKLFVRLPGVMADLEVHKRRESHDTSRERERTVSNSECGGERETTSS